MPDSREHRGPHPDDERLFAAEQVPLLREAVTHLSWLLSHRYAWKSALKLVGDRFALTERQRTAVLRSACADQSLERRNTVEVSSAALRGQPLAIDGFNLLTTIEAALSQGVILIGRDGCFRDMASMHGSYRRVAETVRALELIADSVGQLGAESCVWLLDSPVSNSGRLKGMIQDVAATRGWATTVQIVPDPDPLLAASSDIVVSADSQILDQCGRWFNLAAWVIENAIDGAWRIDLRDGAGPSTLTQPIP